MSYEKQTFVDGDVLAAAHLNRIEEAIAELYTIVGSTVSISEIELLSENWIGVSSPYYQTVMVRGATEHSQIDLKPTIEQLAIFHEKDLAFVTENEDGMITVYALGDRPQNDYTIQVSITEVNVV